MAAAQTPNAGSVGDRPAAVLAEVRRLDTLLAQRDAEYQRIEADVAAAGRWVAITAGPFHLRVAPELVNEVRDGARRAVAALAPTASPLTSDALARRMPVFGLKWQPMRLRNTVLIWMRADTNNRGSVATLDSRLTVRGASVGIQKQLIALAEELAAKHADSTLSAWLRSPRIPLTDRDAKTWADAYRDFASTSSLALRSCREGRADACLTSLGIAGADSIRVADWYATEDYPALLGDIPIARSDTAMRRIVGRCRQENDVEACISAIGRLTPRSIPAPLSASARILFLHEVLRSGGPGAFDRLLSASGTLRDRLTVAAGGPLENVVAQWQQKLEEARPASMTVSPIVALAILSWCGLFSMIGFSRKTLA